MAASEQSLQGSLFEQNKPISPQEKSCQKQAIRAIEDISDEALTEDAKVRPRARKNSNRDTGIEKNITEGTKGSGKDDLPAWSHHELVNSELLTPMMKHYVELKKK